MITTAELASWLKVSSTDEYMPVVVAAVNTYVDGLATITRDPAGAWSETTHLGALMLASRLFRRRNSPNGIESFGDSGATYVSRYDSDIARLLNMDIFAKPRFF